MAMVNKSVGTSMFQNLFILDKYNESKDIMKNGELSCARYVSSLLLLTSPDLITRVRATVSGLEKDLRLKEWYVTGQPLIGSIAFWEPLRGNRHVGFYIGGGRAISNSTSEGIPKNHSLHFEDEEGFHRKVGKFYFHSILKNDSL